MNYKLNTQKNIVGEKKSFFQTMRGLRPLVEGQEKRLGIAIVAIVVNSAINLSAPLLIGYTIDTYITHKNMHGVYISAFVLLGMYIVALGTSYLQTTLMGQVGQRLLFNLRNNIFNKLQELPIAFFNQNKAGDLISRINNDTDKLNAFFSQSLVQFMGSLFVMLGAGIAVLCINWKLGLFALLPAIIMFVLTRGLSVWVKQRNAKSLASVGDLSAEIQESIENFKVVITAHRQDYFVKKFDAVNKVNYATAISAGIANNIFIPLYGLAANIAQIIVLAYGIYLISLGHFTVGLLVSFFSYVTNFYNPLRQLAALWGNFQVALAGWDRVSAILALDTDLVVAPADTHMHKGNLGVLHFDHVHFRYPDGAVVLRDATFTLEQGKTYALVGPTGGGKTTTAMLMARLYDPTDGEVFLRGVNIKTISPEERTKSIGFILQEPFLFYGTLAENIVYGNTEYKNYTHEMLLEKLDDMGLTDLIARFEKGLDTHINNMSESISLGQKQIISFVRAILRNPDVLILDEATANIDTVTEELLQSILQKLPAKTTRIVIAHRLHTIANADEIFFVNNGSIVAAGSMEHALDMLLHGKRTS